MISAVVPGFLHGTHAVRGVYNDNGVAITLGTVGLFAFLVANRRRGSPNAYHPTAISRSSESRPLKHYKSHGLLAGSILDFGSGRGQDCKGRRIKCYEPNHPAPASRSLPDGKFDTVLMTYVVNVIPKSRRGAAVREAAGKVKKGGRLLIAARSTGDSGYQRARSQWKKSGDGHATADGRRFQKFYASSAALSKEVGAFIGTGWKAEPIAGSGSETAYASYRRVQ